MFLIRCSEISKIMAKPTFKEFESRFQVGMYRDAYQARKKTDKHKALLKEACDNSLSAGAKTYTATKVQEMFIGVMPDQSNKYCEKGTSQENESIELLKEYLFDFTLIKNTERKSDEYFTGECDVCGTNIITDIKTPFSKRTFSIFPDKTDDYKWQLRGYMRLFDVGNANTAFCLVNTPEHLQGFEDPIIHYMDDVPIENRVTISNEITRDLEIEALMVKKAKAVQRYAEILFAEQIELGRIPLQIDNLEKVA